MYSVCRLLHWVCSFVCLFVCVAVISMHVTYPIEKERLWKQLISRSPVPPFAVISPHSCQDDCSTKICLRLSCFRIGSLHYPLLFKTQGDRQCSSLEGGSCLSQAPSSRSSLVCCRKMTGPLCASVSSPFCKQELVLLTL